jgi:uncharacterized protein YbjT (DUF2867 family)
VAATILVTGGTGTLGGAVVRRLHDGGHGVRVLSRRPRPDDLLADIDWMTGDLSTGVGLAQAVGDVSAIVHCASDVRTPRHDIEGIGQLTATANARADPPHLVYISIVGVDRLPVGYYRAKLAVEQRLAASGLPYTIQRATQFHDLVLSILQLLARSPVMPLPAGVSCQPIDAGEVADRLVGLALAAPAGRVPDMGGPEVRTVAAFARAYLKVSGRRRSLLPVLLPGKTFAGYRQGAHLTPEHADGQRTFNAFLDERLDAQGRA